MNNEFNSLCRIGFVWTIEHVRKGRVISFERETNIIPTEGLNHVLSIVFKSGSQQANWYVGLYEGNYTPGDSVTAATIAATATECTAYDEAARQAWTSGSVSAGALTNSASKATFTMSATKTVYGGFLISNSTKGGTTGVLASAVRFSTSKPVVDNDRLRVTAGITLISA